jgi:hypothetical protein
MFDHREEPTVLSVKKLKTNVQPETVFQKREYSRYKNSTLAVLNVNKLNHQIDHRG